jgi:hypothetical protein
MRRTSTGPILMGAALVILIAIFGYFAYQLDRQEKKINSIQATTIDDGSKIEGIVNFINTSISNAQKQTNN